MAVDELRAIYSRRRAATPGDDPDVGSLVREGLTPRQADIFLYIFRRSLATGSQPSLREVGDHFGITSLNGVASHLKGIERRGFWRVPEYRASRSLEFLRQPNGDPFRGFACK